jgi:stress-induced morphogen
MNNQQRIEKMRQLLTTAFSPHSLQIEDDSHLHIGHAGAKDGKGHFSIIIDAEILYPCSLVKAHQMIYQALDEMMKHDIHALSIQIKKP